MAAAPDAAGARLRATRARRDRRADRGRCGEGALRASTATDGAPTGGAVRAEVIGRGCACASAPALAGLSLAMLTFGSTATASAGLRRRAVVPCPA